MRLWGGARIRGIRREGAWGERQRNEWGGGGIYASPPPHPFISLLFKHLLFNDKTAPWSHSNSPACVSGRWEDVCACVMQDSTDKWGYVMSCFGRWLGMCYDKNKCIIPSLGGCELGPESDFC